MKNILLPILLLFTVFLVIPKTSAQGDLMVMPKRLVYDGSQRSQEINLANTGQDTAVYAISFINYKMLDNGSFEEVEIPEEGQRFASEFLRYFPRRVTLAPNEAQTIRVQLTRTGNLEEGEYRSHMYFRAVEKQTALGEDNEDFSEGIAIQIKTIFGISIPIIIQNGESISNVSLSDFEMDIKDGIPQLSMKINRTGNMSVYGDILVEHVSLKGEKNEIGYVKGISVYTPNSFRNFIMKLNNSGGLDLKEGKFKITYTSDKGVELATYDLQL